MSYTINHTLDQTQMERGEITCYPWGGSYRPDTAFWVGHDEACLKVFMRCAESEPTTRVVKRNGRVWCDSCMEFFIAPGEKLEDGYFNFEMNAVGAVLLHFGPSREKRVVVQWPMPSDLSLIARREDSAWTLELTVPLALFQKYVPTFVYKPGMTVRGNFYKCGDETAQPHFGCYFPIDAAVVPQPSFHQPDYFGEMTLA